MDLASGYLDLILNLDKHLGALIQSYGIWTYLILFLIIFCETGLVIMPFLPGDSLLFTAGAFAAKGDLNLMLLLCVLTAAGFIGDNVNYWAGRRIGSEVSGKYSRFVKKEYLERTEAYYEKHGSMTIILARFAPILRTFAPFVAGIGRMRYSVFMTYNFVGSVLWNCSFILGGYFFGNIPLIKNNFTAAIFLIIIISLLPSINEVIKHRRKRK
jgi:membrane-associated protein